MNIKSMMVAVLAGAMIAGCAKKEAADECVISVNGEQLMRSQIDADVAAMVKAQGDKIPKDQLEYAKQMIANQLAQSFVVERVLVGKAKAAGYTVTDDDRKAREAEFLKTTAKMPDAPKSVEEYFKKFPLGEARARQEFENGIIIDKMIKAEQAKQPKQDYTAEAKKVIAGIVSNNVQAAAGEAGALKTIQSFKAKLDKTAADKVPALFAEIAKANSACPSSQKGGDLGEFTHGQMVKEFDEVAFKLPVNKVSEPVKTQFGYHLILVTKKVPAVAAKGDKPAEPEKVQASHILIKCPAKKDVPKLEELVKFMESKESRSFLQKFVLDQVRAAKIEAVEEFKQVLPPEEKQTAEKQPAVEKPAAK